LLRAFTSRHPPRPPPFPYTTLFRSYELFPTETATRHREGDLEAMRTGRRVRREYELTLPTGTVPVETIKMRVCDADGTVIGVAGDRKSTRLNSSHVKISYAVFCLKK